MDIKIKSKDMVRITIGGHTITINNSGKELIIKKLSWDGHSFKEEVLTGKDK